MLSNADASAGQEIRVENRNSVHQAMETLACDAHLFGSCVCSDSLLRFVQKISIFELLSTPFFRTAYFMCTLFCFSSLHMDSTAFESASSLQSSCLSGAA
jgi:hypothetical protein